MSSRDTDIDWSLTTWEGSRREQLRRWRKLSLRERLHAVEEMADLARHFGRLRAEGRFKDLSKSPESPAAGKAASPSAPESAVHEQAENYVDKAGAQPASTQDATPTGVRGSRQPDIKDGHKE